MKRLSLTFDTELHKMVKIYAASREVTMNDVVVEAVKEYLNKNVKVAPKSALE
mgnify:CR=1 FL=1